MDANTPTIEEQIQQLRQQVSQLANEVEALKERLALVERR